MTKLGGYIKCLLGFGSVKDGSICWFSKHYGDVHDYPVKKGGDGYPSHFYYYVCGKCGKVFHI